MGHWQQKQKNFLNHRNFFCNWMNISVNFIFWLPIIETHLIQWTKRAKCYEDLEECHGSKACCWPHKGLRPGGGKHQRPRQVLSWPHSHTPHLCGLSSLPQLVGLTFLFLWKSVWLRMATPQWKLLLRNLCHLRQDNWRIVFNSGTSFLEPDSKFPKKHKTDPAQLEVYP